MRKDNLTVIVLALAAVFAAVAAAAVQTQAATRSPSQSAMPIGALADAAAKDPPVQPFGLFTSP